MPEVKHTDSPFPFILLCQPSLKMKIILLVYIDVIVVSPVPLGLCDP